MIQQRLDDLRGAAKTVERTAGDVAKLRSNPGCRENADIQQGLLLIEAKLQCIAEALRNMANQGGSA